MKFSLIWNFALYSMLGYSGALAGSLCYGPDITSRAYHDNYITVWGGSLLLIDTSFHPDVVLFVDSFPSASGNGSSATNVTNRNEFTAFVERSRTVAADHSVAVRWIMHGVLGSNFKLFPTPLEAGTPVTYNGTEFLVQDDCTGHIREAYIAADSISYIHAMDLEAVTVQGYQNSYKIGTIIALGSPTGRLDLGNLGSH
ncbi:uncharacterized protein N7479_003726 [Penicillium vulpinum]|uniref:uncharacterized protein n=1 Tax=Penicillium vulpinum TaxID=29845 RepID=UPI00254967D4|nr:uncharacterized protein N7479_003726 [Penicillium vulpinum]KAJ5963850.1 hypothetical protein N7479_003726 [Penicillium vulpinum]